MRRTIRISLSLLLASALLAGCNVPTPVPGTAQTPSTGTQAQSQPQATTRSTVEGRIVLPFRVSDDMRTQQQVAASVSVSSLRASFDDRPVELEILRVNAGNSESVLSYRIDTLPVYDTSKVYSLEIASSGKPLLGAVVSFDRDHTADVDIDTRSTAVLIRAREKFGSRRLLNLNLSDVRDIERDPALVDIQLSVGSILRSVGTLTTDIIGAVFNGLAELRRKR